MKVAVFNTNPPVFTTCRFRVEYDETFVAEGCDGKPLPESRETYEANTYMKDGQPVPYEDYLRYYGNPDQHVGLVMLLERLCPTCQHWHVTQSLHGLDMMFDDKWEVGVFSVPDLFGGALWPAPYLREVASDLLREDNVTPPVQTHEVYCDEPAS